MCNLAQASVALAAMVVSRAGCGLTANHVRAFAWPRFRGSSVASERKVVLLLRADSVRVARPWDLRRRNSAQ